MSMFYRRALSFALTCAIVIFVFISLSVSAGVSGTGRVAYGSITALQAPSVSGLTVNGVEYLTSSANIIIRGFPNRPFEELKLGMTVRVEGAINSDGRSGTATTVDYVGDIKGTIDAAPQVVSGVTAFAVFGVPVRTDVRTVYEGVAGGSALSAGDWVEVAGFVDARDGSFLATRIDKRPPMDLFEIRGYVSNLTSTTFRLGPSLLVDFSAAEQSNVPAGGLVNGMYVEVRTTNPPINSVMSASRVKVQGSALVNTSVPFGLLQGLPVKVTGATFEMGNQPIVTNAQTAFVGGGMSAVAKGRKTLVTGSVANGLMTAEKVVIGDAAGATADFSGDGKSELLFEFGPNRATYGTYLVDVTFFSLLFEAGGSGWGISHTGDFNGDGKADIVWRNTNGAATLWLMDGGSVKASVGLLGPGAGWTVSHVGDFNGDGKADLLWRNDADGAVNVWLMDGTAVLTAASLLGGGSGWRVSHVGDMNGDGNTDLLWRNDASGAVTGWLMNGPTLASDAVLLGGGSGWRVTHLADFNGDGKADLLWRKDADGAVSSWLMDGTNVAAATGFLGGNTGWRVALVGDLNADGKADLVWRNDSLGLTNGWLMNGFTVAASGTLLNDPAWRVVQLRDVNGDGKVDLVRRNETSSVGSIAVDYMDGVTVLWSQVITGPGNVTVP
jgi:FG-GAP-like repeat/Domain of unknown function (DUF5666)